MKNKLPYIFSFLVLIVPAHNIILSLIKGRLIEWEFMVIFPLSALCVSLLLASVKKIPLISHVLPYIITVGVIALCSFFGMFGYTEYNHSTLSRHESHAMTDGRCSEIDVYEYNLVNIFGSSSSTVIYQYIDEYFDEAVEELDTEHEFYSELYSLNHNHDVGTSFSVSGFDFRVVASQEYDHFPKEVHLIGMNRQTMEIAEVFFSSSELDYISDFTDFTEYDCGWKYIMKKHNRQ